MRKAILVVALISLLVSCRHWCYDHYYGPSDCPQPGIVSIDASLYPSPEPVHLIRGQWVHFFFVNGNDELNIESDVLENQDHRGGHVWGRVRSDAAFGKHKYSIVNVTTRRRNDPTVIIDP
jgi:hypothetical protein